MNNLSNKSVIPLPTLTTVLIAHVRKLAVSTVLLFLVVLESQAASVFFHQYERPVNGYGKYIQIAMTPTGDIYIMDIGSQPTELVDGSRNNDNPVVDPHSRSAASLQVSSSRFLNTNLQPIQQQLIQLGISDSDERIVTGLNNALRTYFANHLTPENARGCVASFIGITIENLFNWIQQLRNTGIAADKLNTILRQLSELGLEVMVPELVAAQNLDPFAIVENITINNQGSLEFALQVTILIQDEEGETPLTATLTLQRNQSTSRVNIPALPGRPGQTIRFNSLPEINNLTPPSPTLADTIQGATATDDVLVTSTINDTPETSATDAAPEVNERELLEQVQAWFLVRKPSHPLVEEIIKDLSMTTSNFSDYPHWKIRNRILGYWRKHQKQITGDDAAPFRALQTLDRAKEWKKYEDHIRQNQLIEQTSHVPGSFTRRPEVSSRPAIHLPNGSVNGQGIDLSLPQQSLSQSHQFPVGNHPGQRSYSRREGTAPVTANILSSGSSEYLSLPGEATNQNSVWQSPGTYQHNNRREGTAPVTANLPSRGSSEYMSLTGGATNQNSVQQPPGAYQHNNRRNHNIRRHNPTPQRLPPAANSAIASNNAGTGPIYGCEHFRRNCDARVRGCNEFYACHRCHEEECQAEACQGKKLTSNDVEAIRCGECGYEQDLSTNEPQQNCPNCNLQLADYVCKKCKHFCGNNLDPFHCDKCGRCRNNKSRSFHCDGCGTCLANHFKGRHECREDSGHDVCCICLESVFERGCQALLCSHKIHGECIGSYIDRGHRRCPICKAPLGPLSRYGKGNP